SLIGEEQARGIDDEDDQDEQQRRKKPKRPSCVERTETDTARPLPLLVQQRRDEKAAEDEEHVDAEKSARRTGKTSVKREHREDRRAAQTVERAMMSEPEALPGGCGVRWSGDESTELGCGRRRLALHGRATLRIRSAARNAARTGTPHALQHTTRYA